MPRIVRAIGKVSPARLGRSQLASSQRRPPIRDVESHPVVGQKLANVSGSDTIQIYEVEKRDSVVQTGAASAANETSSKREQQAKAESELASDRLEPPPAEDVEDSDPLWKLTRQSGLRSPSLALPSFGGISLDEPRTSPFFSHPLGHVGEKVDKQPRSSKEPKRGKWRIDSKPLKTDKGRLAGRKCLVTGATSGIGYAIAKRFLEEGAASVVTVSRSQANISNAFTTMKQALQRRITPFYFIRGDITDAAFRMDSISNNPRLADLDILVNAAGISQSALLTLTPIEKIQQIISTNLTATIALCKMFDRLNFRRNRLASARNKGRGSRSIQHDPNSVDIGKDSPGNAVGSPTPPGIGQGYSPCIINISSLLGIKGGAGATAYAASKAGVIGFTRALVCEHQLTSTSVRVNAIVPGYIDTPMTQALSNPAQQKALQSIPAGRFGRPEEVADAAVFLAANEYANNCVLNLDGGLSAT